MVNTKWPKWDVRMLMSPMDRSDVAKACIARLEDRFTFVCQCASHGLTHNTLSHDEINVHTDTMVEATEVLEALVRFKMYNDAACVITFLTERCFHAVYVCGESTFRHYITPQLIQYCTLGVASAVRSHAEDMRGQESLSVVDLDQMIIFNSQIYVMYVLTSHALRDVALQILACDHYKLVLWARAALIESVS